MVVSAEDAEGAMRWIFFVGGRGLWRGRLEGIVLKQLNSVYQCGDRKGAWIKLKPDYMAGAVETLDVIIVGGYYGDSEVWLL